MKTDTFQRGETVTIERTVEEDGVLVNPSAGVTVTLKQPDGTAAINIDLSDITDTAMSNPTTGYFQFHYRSHSNDSRDGVWNYSTKSTDGEGDGAKYIIKKGSFRLT